MQTENVRALVIGAGPAGLMAAETLAEAGHPVIVAEAKPTPARKFLMAGKSGLNITKSEPFEPFLAAYGAAADGLRPMLTGFGPVEVQDWMSGLGQELFVGSTKRVFPKAMKASPTLRAWLARLSGQGVRLRTRWRWIGWEGTAMMFDTPDGVRLVDADVVVMAMGGASWSRLGSDGQWAAHLSRQGIETVPFAASNVGLAVQWSQPMARHFGAPVKGAALRDGDRIYRGEFIVSRDGLEGAGVYALSPAVRAGRDVVLDLLPDLTSDAVLARLSRPRGKVSLSNFLRRTLGLAPVKIALLREFGGALPEGAALAGLIKALPLLHQGLRPLDQAISTVGGIGQDAVDADLMLRCRPGLFCAGEMLDWDAPTGGYLLTACLATGRWAGRGAANWLTNLPKT